MALQSVFTSHPSSNNIGNYKSSCCIPRFSRPNVSSSSLSQGMSSRIFKCQIQGARFGNAAKCCKVPFFRLEKSPKRQNGFFCLASTDADSGVGASNSSDNFKESSTDIATEDDAKEVVFNEEQPFRGKSGSISFSGLTHELVQEQKVVSSPFKDATGSLVWLLGPLALISSFLLPQFLIGMIDAVFGGEALAEIVVSITNELVFYIGFAAYLLITDHVQQPYLEFSTKRWGLITGLRGYLLSASLVIGFKLVAPLLILYVVWPVLGLPAVLAIGPFMIGCIVQAIFEAYVEKNGSSCWPLVPIVFEIYRLFQLSRAAKLVQMVMVGIKSAEMTPDLVEKTNALVSMMVVIQFLGIVCLWSLVTFLLRLFPSRPVSENY